MILESFFGYIKGDFLMKTSEGYSEAVNVLLSSYNGEKYISTQLDSILSQNYKVNVCVRDDGSRDNTLQLLKEKYSNKIDLIPGSNVGVVASFFDVLFSQSESINFVAFSDQDDYWLPNKIKNAISSLRKYETIPALYCSRLDVVDNDLKHLFYSPLPNKEITLNNSLVENVATGCTIVLNRSAIELLTQSKPNSNNVIMHDWWFYLVISAFGKVVFDSEPNILYRQHGNNVEGMKSGFDKFKAKLKNITKPPKYVKISTQVTEFKRCYYNSLTDEQKKLIDEFLVVSSEGRFFHKLQLVLTGKVYRQTRMDTISFLLSLLLNRI